MPRSCYIDKLAITKTSEYFLFLLNFLFVCILFVWVFKIKLLLFNEKLNLKETAKRNWFIHKEQNISLSKSHTLIQGRVACIRFTPA